MSRPITAFTTSNTTLFPFAPPPTKMAIFSTLTERLSIRHSPKNSWRHALSATSGTTSERNASHSGASGLPSP